MGKGLTAALVALVLSVASCGSDGRPTAPETGGLSGSGVTTTTRPTTPAGMTFGPATSPVDPVGSHVVATGGHVFGDEHGMDQLSWDFTGGTPRCVAEYVSPPVVDEQTGLPVAVAGSAFLRMRCSPVHAVQLVTVDPQVDPPRFPDQLGRYRLSGDSEFPPARNIVEVVQTGWGDGVLTVTVGLRHRAPLGIAWMGGAETPGTGANDVQSAVLVVMQ